MPKAARIGALVHDCIPVGGATSETTSFAAATSATVEHLSRLKKINNGSSSGHFRRGLGVLEF